MLVLAQVTQFETQAVSWEIFSLFFRSYLLTSENFLELGLMFSEMPQDV